MKRYRHDSVNVLEQGRTREMPAQYPAEMFPDADIPLIFQLVADVSVSVVPVVEEQVRHI